MSKRSQHGGSFNHVKTLQKKKRNRDENGEKGRESRKWRILIATTIVQQKANDVVPSNPDAKEKQPASSSQCLAPSNAKQPRVSALKPSSVEKETRVFSRGAMMLQMARGADAILKQPGQRPRSAGQKLRCITKQTTKLESKFELKELKPEHIEYLSGNSVGSGSYGQCFHARYRGIEVIVKQMIPNETTKDEERARRDLRHEASVISALGDHLSLPMIFGVVTKSLPLCVVTKFHGVKEESVTLHQPANDNILTPADCIYVIDIGPGEVLYSRCSEYGKLTFRFFVRKTSL